MTVIRMLNGKETLSALSDLCEILCDCVNGGASVGFMLPFTPVDATDFWQEVAKNVDKGNTIHVVAEVDGKIVGTVQVGLSSKPNQPHRGDLMKLLVHRSARGLGLSRKLMDRVEAEAARLGRTLLVLDTATGSEAEAIYPRFGWERVGCHSGLCDASRWSLLQHDMGFTNGSASTPRYQHLQTSAC